MLSMAKMLSPKLQLAGGDQQSPPPRSTGTLSHRTLGGGLSCSYLKGGTGKKYCDYSSGPLRWCSTLSFDARMNVPDCITTDWSSLCIVSAYYPENNMDPNSVCAALCVDMCHGGDRLGYNVEATKDYCEGAPYLSDHDRSLIPYCNGTFVPGMERKWRRRYEKDDPANLVVVGAVIAGLLVMGALTAYLVMKIRKQDDEENGKACPDSTPSSPVVSSVGFTNTTASAEDLDLVVTSDDSSMERSDSDSKIALGKQPSSGEMVPPPSMTNVEADETGAIETQLLSTMLEFTSIVQP